MSILVIGAGFIFLVGIIVVVTAIISSAGSKEKTEEPMINVRTKNKD